MQMHDRGFLLCCRGQHPVGGVHGDGPLDQGPYHHLGP